MQNKKLLKEDVLSSREVLSYGMGDMACSMVFNFMSSYLLYYYTDVSGIVVSMAGTIISYARLLDAFVNPVVGMYSDKTYSRWGKLRPYLLFSALPLSLAVILMFLTSWVSMGNRSIYAFFTYTLFCLLYTLCNVPYSAMMPNISGNQRQRGRLNMSRLVCASIGSFFSMGLTVPLVSLFGQGNEQRGFLGLSLCFAFIIIVLVLVCFANTKERIQPLPVVFSLETLGHTIKKSRPWVLLCAVQFFHYVALTTRSSTTLYYTKYCLDNEGFASLLLAVNAFTGFATAFAVPLLMVKFSKQTISIWGYSLFALGSLLNYWASSNFTVIFLLNVLVNLGISLSAGIFPLALAEAIDHSEYVTGIRQQGLLTSVSMFMVKLGGVFSSVISGAVLSLGGYTADQPQTFGALLSIKINFIFLPCAVGIVCIALFLFYHLDHEYPAICEELHKNHNGDTNEIKRNDSSRSKNIS